MMYSGNITSDEEEDELYGGFNNNYSPMATYGLPTSVGVGMGVMNTVPSTANFWNPPQTQSLRTGTVYGGGDTMQRPMTSVRAAGYTATGSQRNVFDPLQQSGRGPAPALQKRSDSGPEGMSLEMEKKVNSLVEESAVLNAKGDFLGALDKAKEAEKKEKLLCKYREQNDLADQINIDLTYCVVFNLAVQYHANDMYTEALNTYTSIVRNKNYTNSFRLRINMGNIYFEQKKFRMAIKMYTMALDQIPGTNKDLRFKVMKNIGNAHVRLGQYQDAGELYKQVVEGSPDTQTGFNMLLCFYAVGDKDELKRCFTKLLSIKISGSSSGYSGLGLEFSDAGIDDDDDIELHDADDKTNIIIKDELREEIKERRRKHWELILKGAMLIAGVVEKNWEEGYDYVIEQLKTFELKYPSSKLAGEMEMTKALNYMKHKQYHKAIESLKAFEKKDQQLKARASTNLAYLFFLEGDHANAEKYANLAVATDKYNSAALVNKGNVYFATEEYDRARAMYLEAIKVEADSFQAIYNYGLALKRLDQLDDAIRTFEKLNTLMSDSIEVLYQIAHCYELKNDFLKSIEWYNRLVTRVPSDPGILTALGMVYAKEGDTSHAFHHHLESYRYFPVSMDVISWLGAYFVKNEVFEKAMQFFETAAQIQPNEVKWKLMVASCHRRTGAYQQAKKLYEDIHKKHPNNIECVRYLVQICHDLGLKAESVEYHKQLRKLEARMETTNDKLNKVEESPTESATVDKDNDLSRKDNSTRGSNRVVTLNGSAPKVSNLQQDSLSAFNNVDVPMDGPKKVIKKEDEGWGDTPIGDDLLPY